MLAENREGEYGSEERISSSDERLSNLSKGLDLEVSKRAKALDKKATNFCLQLNELDKIESQLHQAIPMLKNYNLIETTNLSH
jgi:hypothetical protein